MRKKDGTIDHLNGVIDLRKLGELCKQVSPRQLVRRAGSSGWCRDGPCDDTNRESAASMAALIGVIRISTKF